MSFLRRLFGQDDEVAENGLPAVPRPEPRAEFQVARAAAPAPPSPAAPLDDGSVFLAEIGRNKIKVIKIVREATGLGLKQAKDLVESAPVVVASGLDDDWAAALRRELEAAGARVG